MVSDFFHMGGYAFYVWTSYALATVFMLFSWIQPRLRERRLLRDIARRLKRGER